MSIDGCYATHVRWDMPAGTVSLTPGPVMAGGCSFVIELDGTFGHGARPRLRHKPHGLLHYTVPAAQRLPHRSSVDPFQCLTFSLGFVKSGEKYNVIPDKLTFSGTARLFLRKAACPFVEFLKKALEQTHCPLWLQSQNTPNARSPIRSQ